MGRATPWLLVALLATIAGALGWWQGRAQAADDASFPGGAYAYLDDQPDQLFRTSSPAAFAGVNAPPAVASGSHPIRISRDAARRAAERGSVAVVLPDNTRYDVRFEREERAATGDWTFVGRVATPFGELASVLTFGPDGVFGTLPAPDGRMFHVTTNRGVSTIAPAGGILPPGMSANEPGSVDFLVPPAPDADGSTVQRPATPVPPAPEPVPHASAGAVRGAGPRAPRAATADTTTTIDLLGLYTPDLVALRGSVSAAETEYANQVAIANQAHIDTGTRVRFRVAGLSEAALAPEVTNDEALSLITEGVLPDGFDIDALRDELQADFVALLRPYPADSGTCGLAWLNGGSLHPEWAFPEYAFSVSNVGPECTPFVLAHELGHNLGSSHDIEAAGFWDLQYGAFPFSFGYRQGGAEGFATVMAYSQGEPLIGRFSDPLARTCGGAQRCGDAAADNHRSLDYMAANAAAFRLAPGMLSIADASTIEGNADLWFSVSLSSPAPAGGVSFRVQTRDGSGTAGADYLGAAVDVEVSPGSTTAEFRVELRDDTEVEQLEYFEVVIHDLAGATAARDVAVGRILDDDPRARIRGRLQFPDGLPPPASSIEVMMLGTEGRPDTSRSIVLAPPMFEYDVRVAPGYEVAWRIDMPSPFADSVVEFGRIDGDLEHDIQVSAAAQVHGRVLFDEGETLPASVLVTLNQSIVPGAAPGFTYVVEAMAPAYEYAFEGIPGQIAVLAIDNPPAPFAPQQVILGHLQSEVAQDLRLRRQPSASFTWYDDRARERSGELTVFVGVWLSAPAPEGGARITLQNRDGTAKAGEDYVAFVKQLEFAPGTTYQSLQFTLLGDDVPEQEEWFGVDVAAIDGVWADMAAWRFRIVNDDFPHRVSSDADGDGRSDLTWHSVSAQRFESWSMEGAVRGAASVDAMPGWLGVTASGDISQDGVMDAIWVDVEAGWVRFRASYYDAYYRGFDYSEFALPHPGADWRLVDTADTNGDGNDELIWQDDALRRILWWRTDGMASKETFDLPAGQAFAATGDLDGDGNHDLVVTDAARGGDAWYRRGLSTGGFDTARYLGKFPRAPSNLVGSGDIDGDGRDDLIWHDPVAGVLHWWLMQGNRKLAADSQTIDPLYRLAATGDYDGDGRIDLVWRDLGRTELWMWRGAPDGFQASMVGTHPAGDDAVVQGDLSDAVSGGGGGGGALHAGDFDADGRTDLGWFNASLGQFDWWHMEGAVRAGLWGAPQAPDRNVLGTGDFDGDGGSELLLRDLSDGSLYLGTAVPGGSSGETRIDDEPGADWRLAGIADIDGDGRDEVLWRSGKERRLFWWSIEEASVVSAGQQTIGRGRQLAATGDLNGDGKEDLVWHLLAEGRAVAWIASGAGFVETPLGTWPEDARLVAARDIDGDGFADLVWHEPLAGRASWWNMRGGARIATGSKPLGAGMRPVASGDFDGDGLADIAWRDRGPGFDVLRVWRAAPGGFDASRVADYPARPISIPRAVEAPQR